MDEQKWENGEVAKNTFPEVLPEEIEETSPESVEMVDEVISSEPKEAEKEPKKKKGNALLTVYDLMDNFIAALLAVTLIFSFFFRLVGVDGTSMNDTLAHQDRLILQTAFYTPSRGDVVVVYQEKDPKKPLIKRVIATGGDSLRLDVENDVVYLKTAGSNEWKQLDESAYVNYPLNYGILWQDDSGVENEVTVPAGHVFVMGDHRNLSMDSRYPAVGFVPEEDLVGRAIFRVAPFKDFGKI